MVINVEARGVKGPALLFETSSGNRAVMELYKKVRNPYTYSLTTLVYSILPNNTDFSVVKDSIPGMNFSVIDNLKYYHTDKDNFSNISLKSIEHYGLQIVPMLEEYLKGDKYGSKGSYLSGAGPTLMLVNPTGSNVEEKIREYVSQFEHFWLVHPVKEDNEGAVIIKN